MFGLAWSEIIIIAVVALVVVGPKDLPRAMRTAARWMRAGQKLAREFQGHVDELVREAELEELREKVSKAASEPISAHLESMIDPGGDLTEALKPPDPLTPPPDSGPAVQPGETAAATPAAVEAEPAMQVAAETHVATSEPAVGRHDG